jgi:hypothetical protein
MVGVLVMAIIGGVISASVFVVIPWAQDSAAKENLDSVRSAQGIALVRDGTFLDRDGLASAKLLPASLDVGAVTNVAGTCWVAGSRSRAGTTYFMTSKSAAILDDKAGSPDTTWCEHSEFALAAAVTNLALSPSFEVSSATAVVRTNLATNPGFETIDTSTGANGGTHTRSASAAIAGGYGIRCSAPANGIADSGCGLHSEVTVVSGTTYTYSVSVRAVTAGSYNMYLSGNSDNGSYRASVTLAAGEVRRLSLTKTALASGPSTWWVLRGAAQQNAVATFDVDNVLVEASAAPGDYFSGSTPAAGDFEYSWAGTPQESSSSQSAPGASQPHGSSPPTVEYQSGLWSASGTKSVAVTNTGNPGDPHTVIPLDGFGVPGRVYTALITAHVDETLSTSTFGVQEGSAPHRWLGIMKPSGTSITAGDHEYRVTFTVPGDSVSNLRLVLRPGSGPRQTVYYDNFMIVEGEYDGPYLDGNDTGWVWSGAADNSASSGPGVKVP